jgi:O-antigen ligase
VLLGGLLLLVVRQGWLDAALGKDTSTASVRLDYWRATWKMIEEHPWLGVGPGNFGRAYPRYMSPQADELIQDPHNLVLEIWATAGPVAVAFLGLAVLAFFLAPLWSRPVPEAESSPPAPKPETEPRFRWEFYLGGMLGLILSFLLRVSSGSAAEDGLSAQDRILGEGVWATIRSLFWFTSFAILERVHWPARLRGLVLTAGVGALLLNLLVSPIHAGQSTPVGGA